MIVCCDDRKCVCTAKQQAPVRERSMSKLCESHVCPVQSEIPCFLVEKARRGKECWRMCFGHSIPDGRAHGRRDGNICRPGLENIRFCVCWNDVQRTNAMVDELVWGRLAKIKPCHNCGLLYESFVVVILPGDTL